MPDIGFNGTYQQGIFFRFGSGKHFSDGLHFYGVADFGARAVCFDEGHLFRAETGIFQGCFQQSFLCLHIRSGKAIAPAILIDSSAFDDAQDIVAISLRIAQPFQHEDATTFGADETVGFIGKRLAPGIGRQRIEGRKVDGELGIYDDVGSAGNSQIAFAVAQGLCCQMCGHEGGRTGRIERDGRSLQPHEVGDAAGVGAYRCAGIGIWVDQFEVA